MRGGGVIIVCEGKDAKTLAYFSSFKSNTKPRSFVRQPGLSSDQCHFQVMNSDLLAFYRNDFKLSFKISNIVKKEREKQWNSAKENNLSESLLFGMYDNHEKIIYKLKVDTFQ